MDELHQIYFMLGIGIFLMLIVVLQLHFNKVYTRGRHGFKWHEKQFVSQEEAPGTFWTIIGLQGLLGLCLTLLSCIELYKRL